MKLSTGGYTGSMCPVCKNGEVQEPYNINKCDDCIHKSGKTLVHAPEMLELLKDIFAEVRPEISRINIDAGQTIFNPVATETIDMAEELINKIECE